MDILIGQLVRGLFLVGVFCMLLGKAFIPLVVLILGVCWYGVLKGILPLKTKILFIISAILDIVMIISLVSLYMDPSVNDSSNPGSGWAFIFGLPIILFGYQIPSVIIKVVGSKLKK